MLLIDGAVITLLVLGIITWAIMSGDAYSRVMAWRDLKQGLVVALLSGPFFVIISKLMTRWRRWRLEGRHICPSLPRRQGPGPGEPAPQAQEYAIRQGWDIYAEFHDYISGAAQVKPALEKMLERGGETLRRRADCPTRSPRQIDQATLEPLRGLGPFRVA